MGTAEVLLAVLDLVIAVRRFEEPNAHFVAALARAGALGVLDLGRDSDRARVALADAYGLIAKGARPAVRSVR
jgi:hypothetical protein